MSLGCRKKIGVPCAPIRVVPKDAHALAVIEGPRRLDVRHLEAEVMLPALGIALEEFHDRRVRAQRLDQLDLAVGRVDEAHPHPLRRQVERLPHHLRPHPLAVQGDRLPIDGGGDPDMVQASEFHIQIRIASCEAIQSSLPPMQFSNKSRQSNQSLDQASLLNVSRLDCFSRKMATSIDRSSTKPICSRSAREAVATFTMLPARKSSRGDASIERPFAMRP